MSTYNLVAEYSAQCTIQASATIWDVSGNVGIGTMTPSSTAEVTVESSNSPLLLANTASTHYTQVVYQGTGRTWSAGVGNGSEATYGVANKFFVFDSNAGAPRLVVDTTGDVGIGTTNPGYPLDVSGAIYSEGSGGGLAFRDRSGSSGAFWEWYSTGNVARLFLNNRDLIGINTSGEVGIGTTTPTATLEVNGGARFDSDVTIEGPSPWIDVTSYGADPNYNGTTDTTDSTTAINNAIAACPNPAPSGALGCTVFFPPGSYAVSGSGLSVTQSGVKLLGSGAVFAPASAPAAASEIVKQL